MKTQISGYEDEFKMERQEKEKAMKDRRELQADKANVIERHNKLQEDYNLFKQRVLRSHPKPLTCYKPLTEPCCRRAPDGVKYVYCQWHAKR